MSCSSFAACGVRLVTRARTKLGLARIGIWPFHDRSAPQRRRKECEISGLVTEIALRMIDENA